MELITMIVIMFFASLPVAINPTWIMRAILCFVPLVLGLFVMIEGVTYNTTTLITAGANPTAILVFTIMTLGSIVTMYSTSVGKDDNNGKQS